MCGIAGFTDLDGCLGSRAEDVLRDMTARLAHRGPDADGRAIRAGVALGHRRLAIIDLEGGAQPMTDPDSGCRVTFNGEIYNFQELNRALEDAGHGFVTRSDTETILKAYLRWGEACVERFNGMFAFVLHDPRERVLFAARDRLGQKPFFYAWDGRRFIFASEPKALLAHPDFKSPALDYEALACYLIHEYVLAPRSIFAGMSKLPGGHRLRLDLTRRALQVERYWDCGLPVADAQTDGARVEDWAPRIREVFLRAVERHLLADVPLGAFLSGGIDSSAVVAALAGLIGAEKVKTYSIGFRDPSYDESSHARAVANLLGTDHHEKMLEPAQVLEILPEIDRMLDEPLADASILPTYLMTRHAREGLTVALGGDGGDELFAGYDTFRAQAAARRYDAWVPGFLDRYAVRPAAGLLPVSTGNFAFDFKVKQFLRGVKAPEGERLARWLAAFLPEELPALLTPEAWSHLDPACLMEEAHAIHARAAGHDPITQDLHFFTKAYLQDGVLVKVDRASMAHGLEVRAPFLDVELVELAGAMPSHLKYNGGARLKHAFKHAMRGLVPDAIIDRPKKGFGVPLAAWLRGPLRPALEEVFAADRLKKQGLFQPETVRRLLDEHVAGRANHRKPLWTLFRFQRWYETWLARL